MDKVYSLFSPAEYLTTFTTFIYGYVSTQFLKGWSSMVTHRKSIIISKELIAWTFLTFILLIDIWWTSWRKTELIANDNLVFYSTLITPFIFYFLSHLLLPDLETIDDKNLKAYLTPNTRKIMTTFFVLILSFLISDTIFPGYNPNNIYFILGGASLAFVLILFPANLKLRRGFLVLGGVIVLAHMISLLKMKQPFEQIDGFSFIEYLTVFITFIYGFVTYRFLEGWGHIIVNFKRLTLGFDFIPWTAIGFLLMLDMWWGTWAREEYLSKSILYFMISMAVPVLFYFMSAVIFPLEHLSKSHYNFDLYYLKNNRIICLFFGLILLTNGIVSYLMEESEILSLENIFRVIGFVIAIFGMFSYRLLFHRIILALGFIMIIVHAFSD